MPLYEIENAYIGRDNSIDLILKADDVAVNLSTSTAMKLVIGKEVINSTNGSTQAIQWNQSTLWATGEVRLYLGSTALSIKAGKYSASLIVYGSTYINGLVWDDQIPIRIIKDLTTT